MTGHVDVHGQPNTGLRGHVPDLRWASAMKQRVEETRLALAGVLRVRRGSPWMTEEGARACRRHSLIEDNPSSG